MDVGRGEEEENEVRMRNGGLLREIGRKEWKE